MFKIVRLIFTYPNPDRVSVLRKDIVDLKSRIKKTANRHELGGMHHNGMM